MFINLRHKNKPFEKRILKSEFKDFLLEIEENEKSG